MAGWARRHRAALVRVALEVAGVGLAGVVLLHRRGSMGTVGTLLGHLHWGWLLVAIAAQVGSVMALARLQRWLLRIGAVRLGLGTMALITLASNALSRSLPAGVAVSEGYAFQQYRRRGVDGVVAAWVQLASGAWSVAALAGVVLAGVALAGGGPGPVLRITALVVFTGALAVAVLFRYPTVLVRALGWVLARGRRLLPGVVCRLLGGAERAIASVEAVRPSGRAWLAAGGFAALNWLADCACLVAAFLAVGGPVPWRGVLLAYGGAQLLAALPITPGGLGLVEGGLMLTLVAYGGEPAASGAAVLLYRGVSFWLVVATGWLAWLGLALHDRRQHAVAVRDPVRDREQPLEPAIASSRS